MTESIRYLFHFTDRRNLPSIKETGGLFSYAKLKEMGIEIPAPGGNDWSHDADAYKGKAYIQSIDQHPTDPIGKVIAEDSEGWASYQADSLNKKDPNERLDGPEYREFYSRYDALKTNPKHPPVYHYDGMPYCKEL